MLPWILLLVVTLLGGAGWYLFYRSARVMFNFDQVLGEVGRILGSYAVDLAKLSSGDLLLDHPEVRAFHKRNILALEEINAVIDDIKQGRPEGPRETLPRPDVG